MATSSTSSKETTPPETKLDSRFSFGPPPIQTPEDATMAYLREEITEDEYRAALGKFGTLPGQVMKSGNAERADAAFKNTIPDDIYNEQPLPSDDLKTRQEAVQKEEDERKAATEKAEAESAPPSTSDAGSTSSSSSTGS